MAQYNLDSNMADRVNFDDAVKRMAAENFDTLSDEAKRRPLNEWYEDIEFLAGNLYMPSVDNMAEAKARFINAYWQAIEAQLAEFLELEYERSNTDSPAVFDIVIYASNNMNWGAYQEVIWLSEDNEVMFRYVDQSTTEPWQRGTIKDAVGEAMYYLREKEEGVDYSDAEGIG